MTSDEQLPGVVAEFLFPDSQQGQTRNQALEALSKARTIYTDVCGARGVTVLKVAKQEVAALIRSPRWAKGYHLVLRPDLGRAALLSACKDHAQCQETKL